MYRVLITGSRKWTDRKTLGSAIDCEIRAAYPDEVMVIHGWCPSGADKLADEFVAKWPFPGLTVTRYAADWSLGKHAGFIRNQKMVDLGADVCLAFPTAGSKGTWDCIRRAQAAGIEVKIFAEEQLPVREIVREAPRGLKADLVNFDEAHELIQGELF